MARPWIAKLLWSVAGALSIYWLIVHVALVWDDQRAATKMAAEHLATQGMRLDEFTGPELFHPQNARPMYSWTSISRAPPLKVEASPSGDQVCLYQVLSAQRMNQIICRIDGEFGAYRIE